MSEQYTFQAETQQVLNILIHSLYTDREIFLRELISNASDALNRIQFEQLTNQNVLDPDAPLEIRLTVDEEAGTLTLSDSGIGMTHDEVIDSLGTIAKSGAKAFIEAVKDNPNTVVQDVIGQFGVGFYSVFMVADKVEVVSRSFQPDAAAIKWQSDGGNTYTIEPAEREHRGTDIIIYLKEEAKEFANGWTLKDIIRRHSNYIAFPIYVDDDENAVNKQTAIWRQDPKEVTDEEYDNFYKMYTMDFGGALHRIHMRADVPLQFYALLFVPSTGEQNMFSPRKEAGLQLYARKVLIQDYCKDLLPEYLSFVQGVVDSEDLPLNVSRESVQASRVMANLQKSITRKVLGELKRMAEKDTEQYLEIFEQFGRYLKQGVVVSPEDKDDVQQLLYFTSSHDDDPDSFHSLADYVSRMADGQDDIYYVIADDFTSARRSPHLDAFRQRGIEVLYFTDPVDTAMLMGLTEYQGHKLRNVDEADIDLKDVGTVTEDEQPQEEPLETATFEALRDRFAHVLGQRVKGVRESKTLVGSPARLVSDETGAAREMFRINRLLDKDYQLPIKTLELNPRHPLMHNLVHILDANADSPVVNVVIEQVFENALLQDGIHPDPAAMTDRLTLLMQAATGGANVDFSTVAPIITEITADTSDDEAVEEETVEPEGE